MSHPLDLIVVDTDSIRGGARSLRRLSEDVPQRALLADRDSYGHPDLAQAAAAFAVTWERAAKQVSLDLAQYADSLTGCADDYDAAEGNAVGALGGIDWFCEGPELA